MGASLEEILKWRMGLYPRWFQAEVLAFYPLNLMVDRHVADANEPRKGKK